MSKKEMENLDEQVLQVANSAGEARCADEAKQAEREAERSAKACCEQADKEEKRQIQLAMERKKMRRLLKMLARATACFVAAGVFLAMMLDPKFWVPVVGCVGVMTFIVVGAICIDRYFQRCK